MHFASKIVFAALVLMGVLVAHDSSARAAEL